MDATRYLTLDLAAAVAATPLLSAPVLGQETTDDGTNDGSMTTESVDEETAVDEGTATEEAEMNEETTTSEEGTTESGSQGTTSGTGPGFTVALGPVALAAVGLLAARRRS